MGSGAWIFLQGKAHAEYRRGLIGLFTNKALGTYSPIQEEVYNKYLGKLVAHTESHEGRPAKFMDMFRQINCALSCRTFFGNYNDAVKRLQMTSTLSQRLSNSSISHCPCTSHTRSLGWARERQTQCKWSLPNVRQHVQQTWLPTQLHLYRRPMDLTHDGIRDIPRAHRRRRSRRTKTFKPHPRLHQRMTHANALPPSSSPHKTRPAVQQPGSSKFSPSAPTSSHVLEKRISASVETIAGDRST